MATYVKKSCPHCGHVIQNWKMDNGYWITKIGEPFFMCPRCLKIIIDKKTKEYYMFTNVGIAFYIIKLILFALLVGMLIGVIVWQLLSQRVHYILIMGIFSLLAFLFFYYRFNKDVKESKKRTALASHANILLKLKLIPASRVQDLINSIIDLSNEEKATLLTEHNIKEAPRW